jgi:hypothetical protein
MTLNPRAIGWKANDFALSGVDGKTYSLSDVRGLKGIRHCTIHTMMAITPTRASSVTNRREHDSHFVVIREPKVSTQFRHLAF